MPFFLQITQKSSAPISTGSSRISVMSVVTAESLGYQVPEAVHFTESGVHGQRGKDGGVMPQMIGCRLLSQIGDESHLCGNISSSGCSW